MRKKNVKGQPNRVRVSEELQRRFDELTGSTGWSFPKALEAIAYAGFGALQQSPDEKLDCQPVKMSRELIRAAQVMYRIELTRGEELRRARGAVRAAESRLRGK